jgi:hypothetical protein
MSNDFKMIFPEKRMVSAQTVIGWAQDHLIDAGTPNETLEVQEAVDILEDAGLVTFDNRHPRD